MKGSKVYIVNYAGYDYSAAAKYGKLVPVTKGTIDIFKEQRLAYDIKQALADFDPDKDYLLFSGSNVINVVASSILLARFFEYKCLIYGAKRGDYVERVMRRDWPDMLDDEDSQVGATNAINYYGDNTNYTNLTNHSLTRGKKINGCKNR